MTQPFRSALFALLFFYAAALQAQSESDFNNCSAIFLNDKMLVNQYSPEGKCTITTSSTGKLSMHPVELLEDGRAIPKGDIRFKVAIRGLPGNSLMLWSERTYTEIELSKILPACKKGESIVLLTLEREWAVPHNEILIE